MKKNLILAFFTFILLIKILHGTTNYLIPIGHDTVFIRLDRINIITDPNWNSKDLFLHRLTPPPFPLTNLPSVDLVLISHGHFDHFDLETIKGIHKKNRNVRILLPKKLGYILKKSGITNYRECLSDEEIRFRDLFIRTFQAKHDGRRFLIDNTSLSLMYLIKGSRSIFFTGDTGYTNLFPVIGRNEKIDIAMIMIGQWSHMPNPVRSRHLQSDESVRVFKELKAKFMLPVHYDTFPLGYGTGISSLELLLRTAESNKLRERIWTKPFGTQIIIK
ncbi:MAG: MBL fold metallo-hydrolase [bacterium]|nr:MBL fold metallo-hydrolase [bacterium]